MNKILFLTSNRTKYQHACYLCRDYDVKIVLKSNYGVAYNEPRTPDRNKLLTESIEDAKKRLLRQTGYKAATNELKDIPLMINEKFKAAPIVLNKLFFIEDTSVKIYALSTESNEVPGTDIKYWMREHNFASVDKLLKEHGNNRRVSVRSDILLYLPKELRGKLEKDYIQFTSTKHGTITEKEHNFQTNELYPWLDNRSFNKWFVPDGCIFPLSMLPRQEADKYDFRAGAFMAMLDFLEKERIINRKVTGELVTQEILSFFDNPVFLLCGLPCAGKTTLGEYLSVTHGYYHIEASDFMSLSYYERHGIKSSVRISDFAEKVLKETPSIVAEQVYFHLANMKDTPFIITGFRSPKELDYFIKRYRGLNYIHQVFVDAKPNIRYKRNIDRNREGDNINTKKDFRDRDKQQLRMGLRKIRTNLKNNVILNNSSLENYFQIFLDKYPRARHEVIEVSSQVVNERPTELEDTIIITLLDEHQYLTTTEISNRINSLFPNSSFKTSKNNVSRYFNQKFHPYYDIKVVKNKNRYRLSPTGRSKARFLLNKYVRLIRS